MTTRQPITTQLISRWRKGDADAKNAVFASVHREIEAIARVQLQGERRRVSIATDDLVNETMVRLLQSEALHVNDRAHLLALCASVMRSTLVDAARRRNRAKRNIIPVTLTASAETPGRPDADLLALDHALLRLKAIDPDAAHIVEMRYFGGMSIDDVAEVLGTSPSSAKRAWRVARAWLKEAITHDRQS